MSVCKHDHKDGGDQIRGGVYEKKKDEESTTDGKSAECIGRESEIDLHEDHGDRIFSPIGGTGNRVYQCTVGLADIETFKKSP